MRCFRNFPSEFCGWAKDFTKIELETISISNRISNLHDEPNDVTVSLTHYK